MTEISYIKGDVTVPQAAGFKIISHICNDLGGWGRGFVVAVSKRWPEPERQYRAWHASRNGFVLGAVQFVQVDKYLLVANMIAQHGMKHGSGGPPIRYDALDICLDKIGDKAAELKASVHMPRIGCGLAGGKWSMVEPLIKKNLCDRDLAVTVYDYE